MTDLVCKYKVLIVGHPNQRGWCGVTDDVEMVPDVGPRCYHHRAPGKTPHPHGMRIRAIMEADKLTLTRDERHQLAEYLVGHTGSWSRISEDDAKRVGDALHGFLVIQALLLIRRQNRGGS